MLAEKFSDIKFQQKNHLKIFRTFYTNMLSWFKGRIIAFQAIDPGSSPGESNLYILLKNNMYL